MIIKQNISVRGLHSKPVLTDVFYTETGQAKPIVIFSHGFKGFKDWGVFKQVAMFFAEKGFVFVKFNFSHNGTTVEDPSSFGDLEAFSDNTFSKEIDDLGTVIDWIYEDKLYIPEKEKDLENIYLLGHSRGGGITILKANEDLRIKKLATWASVNVFGRFWDEDTMKKWKEEGVMIIKNSRTNQDMPLKYQLYEDYFANLDRLHIPTAVKNINRPFLVIHGDNDEAVSVEMAKEIHDWNQKTQLHIIAGEGHTFGAKHPWDKDQLPPGMQKTVDLTVEFYQSS